MPKLRVAFASEAALRDHVAGRAEAAGFTVEVEKPLPPWGRADLVLTTDVALLLVECKLAISGVANLRRAASQAWSYAEILTIERDRPVAAYVVADQYDNVERHTRQACAGALGTHPLTAAEFIALVEADGGAGDRLRFDRELRADVWRIAHGLDEGPHSSRYVNALVRGWYEGRSLQAGHDCGLWQLDPGDTVPSRAVYHRNRRR